MFTPAVDGQDSIVPPWSTISLTDVRMKPGYPFVPIETKNKIPWWPITAGVIGAGIITYLLLPADESNNCSFDATFDIHPPSCNSPNGSASILVNPPGSYNYKWSNGSPLNEIKAVGAGNYSVTVTDSKTGCSKVFSTTLQNTVINIQIQLITQSSDCGLDNGMITALINPSPGFYFFQWSNGETTPRIQNLKPGNYQLTVSAGGNCTKEASAIVEENPPTFKVSSQSTPDHCKASDGTINITVDPPGNYSFVWSNGMTTPNLINLKAGNYTVTVSIPGTVCSVEHSVLVEEDQANFTIQLQTTPEYCDQSNGSASATVMPLGNYNYAWSNGSTTERINNLKAGTHQLTVTEQGTNCQLSQMFKIEHKIAEHNVSVQTSPASCGLDNGRAAIQVEPPGNYMILWSTGTEADTINDIPPGSYSVTATDINNCSVSAQFIIEESPAKYVSGFQVSPGNCIGDHTNIRLSLESPGPGPMNITATGPNGQFQIQQPKTTIDLRYFFKIIPGSWLIRVQDSKLKSNCLEELNIEVPDSSDFITRPDSFKTYINKTISGNVLANDTGISIKIISHVPPVAGNLALQNNGSFTYSPQKDSTGIFQFKYTVKDSCNKIKEQIAVILVDSGSCDFTVKFTSDLAHCGLADGRIMVSVDSPGTYTYLWSTGQSGPVLMNAAKGQYTVNITNEVKKCSLEFNSALFELPAEFIRNIRITQPSCQQGGQIRFEVFSPGTGPMKMILSHPGGGATHTIPLGNLNLASYAPIVPGEYSISVYDESSGLDCIQELNILLEAPAALTIKLEGVIPPSSPSASDGTALIFADLPGALPYVVLLNNSPYITAFDHFIEISGLGAGTYMIQLRDANNCLSNKLTVVIPVMQLEWTFGLTINKAYHIKDHTQTPELANKTNGFTAGAMIGAEYSLFDLPVSSILLYSKNNLQNSIDLEQWMSILKWNYGPLSTQLEAGCGLLWSNLFDLKPKGALQISSEYKINSRFSILGIIKNQTLRSQPVLIQLGLEFNFPSGFIKKVFPRTTIKSHK